jgi:hypothetical protein
MKHIIRFLIVTLFILTIAIFPAKAYADTCVESNGDVHITGDCSFSGDTGLDAGSGTTNTTTLYIDSGIVTLQPNQIVGVGKIVMNGGILSLASDGTAAVKPGAGIWMIDADGDGYPASEEQTISSTSPGAEYVRRNTLVGYDLASVDCYDTGTDADQGHPGATFQASARDGGSWDWDCSDAVTYQYQTCACQTCTEGCPSSPVCTLHETDSGYTCGGPMTPGPGSCTRVNDGYGACIACNNGADGSYVVLCK